MGQFETFEFETADGFKCNLKHPQGQHPTKKPVLLVHGAGVRGNIFNPPTSKNLIQCLMEEGYDVWVENWRGSIEFPPNQWDLDQVALNDHPAAVKKVVELTGSDDIMAIIHCQGSSRIMISSMLGLIRAVRTIFSNAVSVQPVVPDFSLFGLWGYMPLVKNFFAYRKRQWELLAPDLKSKRLSYQLRPTHDDKETLEGK